jgi:hypothetical protein
MEDVHRATAALELKIYPSFDVLRGAIKKLASIEANGLESQFYNLLDQDKQKIN